MASVQSSEHLGSRQKVVMYDHDPGATSALITTPDGGATKRIWDMRDYLHFGVLVMTTILGGNGVTKVEIVAGVESDMSGTLRTIKDSGTVAADAMADQVFLECSAEEIAQIGAENSQELRYVAARITCHHAGDEAVVTYIGLPRYPATGLTATAIA